MQVDTIFFDLDSTLYPEKNGLWQAIRDRIDDYMAEVMGFSRSEIPNIRQQYLSQHGTTLKGLQTHFGIDAAEYLEYVHDLPLKNYLAPDPLLREILLSIPHRRWVFTNADAKHANRVMASLGIIDCFEGMIDVWRMEPYCKPQEDAYKIALDAAGRVEPDRCALIDDSLTNLLTARKVGFFTVLVGENGKTQIADRYVETIHDLPEIVPEFWSR